MLGKCSSSEVTTSALNIFHVLSLRQGLATVAWADLELLILQVLPQAKLGLHQTLL
jgi:hypothetical protein